MVSDRWHCRKMGFYKGGINGRGGGGDCPLGLSEGKGYWRLFLFCEIILKIMSLLNKQWTSTCVCAHTRKHTLTHSHTHPPAHLWQKKAKVNWFGVLKNYTLKHIYIYIKPDCVCVSVCVCVYVCVLCTYVCVCIQRWTNRVDPLAVPAGMKSWSAGWPSRTLTRRPSARWGQQAGWTGVHRCW